MTTQTYQGGCHCGAVRYEVTADLSRTMSCNCSYCTKRGSILTFAPMENFRLLAGGGGQREYQFYKRHIHHLFCEACGVQSYAFAANGDGKDMVAINVRCLDDVDLALLRPQPFDGRSL